MGAESDTMNKEGENIVVFLEFCLLLEKAVSLLCISSLANKFCWFWEKFGFC